MLRRPPPFPLFPYTTLFRSEVQPRIVAAQVACRVVDLANLRPASGIHAHRGAQTKRIADSPLGAYLQPVAPRRGLIPQEHRPAADARYYDVEAAVAIVVGNGETAADPR